MDATQLVGDYEEWIDTPSPVESPASKLWRMRRLQADAILRGWDHADIDAWLADNAARIEAEYAVLYAELVK